MIIKNTTVLTGEEAIHETAVFGRKTYYKKFIFPSILMVLGVIVIIITFQSDSRTSLLMGALFLVFSSFLCFMNLYAICTIKKRTKKKNPKLLELGMKNEFIFKEESFSLCVTVGTKSSKLEYPYQNIKSIVEYEDKILFLISENEFYSCKKDSFASQKELDLFFYGLNKHQIKIKNKLKNPKDSVKK